MNLRCTAAFVALVLATACTPPTEPVPQEFRTTVGRHDIGFRLPPGWNHLDHGLQHRVTDNRNHLSLADLGPVTSEGYLREIYHALGLFRNGQVEDAVTHLHGLKLESMFPENRTWRLALQGGHHRSIPASEVEEAYGVLIREVQAMEPADPLDRVQAGMPSWFRGAHREVAVTERQVVDGRPAVRVTTWDRLTHDHRSELLFVFNADDLLLIRTELGDHQAMLPVFEGLADSLEIHPRPQG